MIFFMIYNKNTGDIENNCSICKITMAISGYEIDANHAIFVLASEDDFNKANDFDDADREYKYHVVNGVLQLKPKYG